MFFEIEKDTFINLEDISLYEPGYCDPITNIWGTRINVKGIEYEFHNIAFDDFKEIMNNINKSKGI